MEDRIRQWARTSGASLAHCPGGFGLACWNGDILRGAFIIDAHDREIMALHRRGPRIFARQFGPKPCFTPVTSPQGNGISAAFVNTPGGTT